MELPEEHKIIRDKLNAVVELPAGYTPNLQSKWELLEAGLEPEKKKRRIFFSITRIGIAASLLLIGGAGMVYYLLQNKTKQAPAHAAVPMPRVDAPVQTARAELVQQEQVKPVHQTKRKRKHEVHHEETAPVYITEEIAIQDSMPVQVTEAVALTKVKAARYTEIDFNEPVINDKAPSQTVIAAQQFKFRISLGNKSNASSGDRSGNGLRKQFN